MIEVFATNVQQIAQAKKLIALLLLHFPGRKINFDLHDCDSILRMEGDCFNTGHVVLLLLEKGFDCKVLE